MMTSLISTGVVIGAVFLNSARILPDDVAGLCCGLHDPGRGGARLVQTRRLIRQPRRTTVAAGDNRGQRLVHLVSDRRGQLAHGHHPIHMRQLRLRLA